MRRTLRCFLLPTVTSIVYLVVGYGITRYNMRQEQAVPNTVIETETVNNMDDKAVMNQEETKLILESASPTEKYYLVLESDFLLILYSDKSTIYLYTHTPVTDFSEMERAKLMGGIWFPFIVDTYHYLEPCTSQGVLEYIF